MLYIFSIAKQIPFSLTKLVSIRQRKWLYGRIRQWSAKDIEKNMHASIGFI
ncbi:hypothetical protein B4119_3579 [Parageobacillus caldoxylosilyticus]|uniref:Uncharacterized protein n=1 Tax=Saccharococcus caldoxylosilyticus TaxID=81408 RepID=A0A150M4F8_9BACL|nr:hypothetical protein B4119_3579 [Parageobacillus caldoxylosilyticus]